MLNTRRAILSILAITGIGGVLATLHPRVRRLLQSLYSSTGSTPSPSLGDPMILKKFPIGFQWPVQEPFLFCVHHRDEYPAGQPNFGPDPKLLHGRQLGQDFEERHGFRMYHGNPVPGFPVHPHRGFETITVVRRGYIDHADSLGAAGRYGEGDVQWMTAGSGVQHSEMFPLLKKDQANPAELFQIWLNLPRRSKMAAPHFTMFWSEKIPRVDSPDGKCSVTVIAGSFDGATPLAPPPNSWAADPENEVTILLVKMRSGGRFRLPTSKNKTARTLYYFAGEELSLNGQMIPSETGFILDSAHDIELSASSDEIEFLILQARPIGEPTVQYGPFVMNSREEILQTIRDYEQTEFGGWPWPRADMIHGPTLERFAKYPDGKLEKPQS